MSPRLSLSEDLGRPGFRRLLAAVRRQYVSRGGAGQRVQVRISAITAEESELIGGFLGRFLVPGEELRVTLREVEELLQRYYRMDIPALFAELEGRPLLSRTESAEKEERQWRELFRSAREVSEPGALPAAVLGWLAGMERGEAQGYRTLRDLYREEGARAEASLRHCLEALRIAGQYAPAAVGGAARAAGAAAGSPPGAAVDSAHPGAVRPSGIRLPVLAARVTGDSHAFDAKYPLGRLLWYALAELVGGTASPNVPGALENEPGTLGDALASIIGGPDSPVLDALTLREVYRRAGILDDDLSSQVMVWGAGLPAGTEPTVLTLRQVERFREWPLYSALYAVENPAVFSALLDAMETVSTIPPRQYAGPDGSSCSIPVQGRGGHPAASASPAGRGDGSAYISSARTAVGPPRPSSAVGPALICTSGQPSVAAVRFIEGCLKQAAAAGLQPRLYYSGDFDVSGLQIASGLAGRFADAFIPWRMDASSYGRLDGAGPLFTAEELARLAGMELTWAPDLPRCLASAGRKAFQELLVEELAPDWLDACGWGRS